MGRHRSSYLVDQLLGNNLSRAELDEFLAGFHHPDDRQTYSDVLESYFNELLNESEYPPDAGGNGEPLITETKANT